MSLQRGGCNDYLIPENRNVCASCRPLKALLKEILLSNTNLKYNLIKLCRSKKWAKLVLNFGKKTEKVKEIGLLFSFSYKKNLKNTFLPGAGLKYLIFFSIFCGYTVGEQAIIL